MKGVAIFTKKLEILSIPDSRDVLKLKLARMTSYSEISERIKASELCRCCIHLQLKDFYIRNFCILGHILYCRKGTFR